ncbi:hypothetical protein [Legionella tucsonensis]|uniref:Uncharacterized protein n=1 Tax=Legionella tucsonensis TaxID=40335 RepID=A0A0W0ZY65_9GAMM|nr:hypothetical protein [Legionella tucsonensis]KTD74056.1 hypothetical protein Ltuc_1903 [Legionella tucsonensis]
MTRLEELIYALATVIVRYHDSQVDTRDKLVATDEPTTLLKKKSYDRAIEIIQDTKTNFVPYLEGRINACTKGYHGREEFLSFLLHEIRFLKEQLERKTPFDPAELQTFQEQLTQLLIDFRQLLNIKKGFKYPVTLNPVPSKDPKTLELSGLLNDRYVGNKYCNSGQLLIEEVLFVLHMTAEDTNGELKKLAANICFEQQIFLKNQSSELKEENEESEKEALKLESETQKLKLEEQQSINGALTLENAAQKLKLEELQAELEKLKSSDKQKSESDPSPLELIEENKKLTAELEKTKQELCEAKSEARGRRFPVYTPYYGGLAALNMLQPGGANRFFQQQSTQFTSLQSLPKPEDSESSTYNLSIE